MALFEVPQRSTREQDKRIANKVGKTSKNMPVIKGGNDILGRINQIRAMVETKLGKYKDRYQIINNPDDLQQYLQACVDNGVISIDTETSGLDPLLDDMAGICIYTPGQKGAYIPIGHRSYITQELVSGQMSKELVKFHFEDLLKFKINIIMFNAKFDIRVLRNQLGLKDIYCSWDCYLAARLMNENEEFNGLKKLHQKYVLHNQEDAFSFGELFKGIPFTLIPINTGYLYAARDPEITYELYEYQKQFMYYDPTCTFEDRNGMNGVSWVFENIEMPCVSVVADMEDTGVAFDTQYAQELSNKYHKEQEACLEEFYKCLEPYSEAINQYRISNPGNKLSDPISISSPTQLSILFYDILKVECPDPKSPRGTGEEILQKINNPVAKVILKYRTVDKLLGTYIDKLPECVNPNDKRIHCSFNQYGANTGRFSSSEPNLQNIPSHNKDIRKMFVASPGYVLMSSDYSQQEPKVMTQMCGDEKMLRAYQEGKDLYAQIAAIAFNTEYQNCLEFYPDGTTNKEGKERRTSAKSILLGILYGRGIKSVAEQLHTTKEKAQLIQDKIFKGFPAIPKFERDSMNMALELGYVTTLWGRKRRLPNLQLEEYEFKWKNGTAPNQDLLDWDTTEMQTEVPESKQNFYINKLDRVWGNQKRRIFEEALAEGIIIIDNGGKISDAERQVVNSRIQGSAADMSKLAMILVGKDERLKELGFRLLIPVHDELIAECPKENAKEASERFAMLMSKAAESKLTVPISCDVEITERWYGERIAV